MNDINIDIHEDDLDDLAVLYASGSLAPDVASSLETELQNRPDLSAQVEGLRFLNGILKGDFTPPDDVEDYEDYAEVEEKADVAKSGAVESIGINKELVEPRVETSSNHGLTYEKRFLSFRVLGRVAALAMLVVFGGVLFLTRTNNSGTPTQVAQNNDNEETQPPRNAQGNGSGGSNPLKNSRNSGGGLSIQDPGPVPASASPGGVDDDISPEEIWGDDFKEGIDVQSKNVGVDSTILHHSANSNTLQIKLVKIMTEVVSSQMLDSNEETLLATFSKESQDKPEVRTAVSQFYKLLRDTKNIKVEDFESISNALTREIIGNDKELESFKAMIDEIVKRLNEDSE